ncbi:MAG: glycosyltransferase family 4 protein [Pseudomonadota bacterium]
MRILQVNKFFYRKGGSEAYLFSLIDGLKDHGIDVAEFSMQDLKNRHSDYEKYFVSNIDYDNKNLLEKIKIGCKIFYSIEARKKIGKLIDVYKPDLVHLHIFQHQLSPSILLEIKKRNIPIVYTAHDLKTICPNYKMLTHDRVCEECLGHKYYKCIQNQCVKNSYIKSAISCTEAYLHLWLKYYDLIDLIITPSKFYRKKLIKFRFPADKVLHVPNFINEKQFVPHYNNDGYFIYLGRLSEEKGILTLVDAMKSITRGKLIIIGTGPVKEQIISRVASLGLKNIELVGFQTGDALNNYISNAMFSVIPSEWYENGPISLLESFACGRPVIGSDMGGIPEHITHGKDGLIFEARNSKDLANKINILLNDPDLLESMAKAARKKAEELYTKNKHLKTMIRLYEQLIK